MWLPKGTSDKGARRDRGVGWLVFATAILVYVSTTGGSLTTTDAVVTYHLWMATRAGHDHALTWSGLLLAARGESTHS